jgi:CMP-N,N'-diacetyllegionaminic acid synthase
LRTAADIDSALERCIAAGARTCVSVTAVEQSPYWMYRIDDDERLHPLIETPPGATRRQDLPAVYALNGAVYVADVAELKRTRSFVGPGTVAHVMPPERSIDIDTAADFESFRRAVSAPAADANPTNTLAQPIGSTQPAP